LPTALHTHLVDTVERTGRLLHLKKAAGGIRPLVITGVLRQIAFKTVVATIAGRAAEALGIDQYAIGQTGATETLYHRLCAQTSQPGMDVAAVDITNAVGTWTGAP